MRAAQNKAGTAGTRNLNGYGTRWSGIKNGKLLALAAPEFDVFITVDQNLKYQQNLKNFNIAIILLVARNNRFKTLLPLMPEAGEALDRITEGEFIRIGGN